MLFFKEILIRAFWDPVPRLLSRFRLDATAREEQWVSESKFIVSHCPVPNKVLYTSVSILILLY